MRNREAQVYSVSSKAVMIKQFNAITTKNEFSLYRKSRENRDEKKWIGKINKITTHRLAKALSNKSLVRFV